MIVTLFVGIFFLVLALGQRFKRTSMAWRSVDTVLRPRVANPYRPVETGYQNMLTRSVPQFFYKRGTVVGDVSPLNPIPYVSVVPERRDLNMSDFGFAYVDPTKQARLLDEKLNKEENPRLVQNYRIPTGVKSWRRHNVKYKEGFI